MALPEHVGLGEALLRGLACSAEKRDSLQKTPAAQGKDGVQATCGKVKDPGKR